MLLAFILSLFFFIEYFFLDIPNIIILSVLLGRALSVNGFVTLIHGAVHCHWPLRQLMDHTQQMHLNQ